MLLRALADWLNIRLKHLGSLLLAAFAILFALGIIILVSNPKMRHLASMIARNPLPLLFQHARESRSVEAGAFFKSQLPKTIRIELRRIGAKEPNSVVSSSAQIDEIISSISFSPKPPCQHVYASEVVFVGADITALVSEHSLVMSGHGHYGDFHSPGRFFKLYQQYLLPKSRVQGNSK